jgi:hypothetical protein
MKTLVNKIFKKSFHWSNSQETQNVEEIIIHSKEFFEILHQRRNQKSSSYSLWFFFNFSNS